MYLIKHKSIAVFVNVNGVYKAWSQCESPQIFKTEEEVNTFCEIARIKDGIPFLVCLVKDISLDPQTLFAPTMLGDYGILNAHPWDLVEVTHLEDVGRFLFIGPKYICSDLIFEF